MRDALAVIIGIGILVGLSWWAGLPYWAVFWAGLLVWLAVMELVAKVKTGRTLSQRFWAYRQQHTVIGWVVWGAWSTALVVIALHLIAK